MTTLAEHNRQMAEREERRIWTDKVDAVRPTSDQRYATARATGSCADAGYSTREYALTLRRPSGALVTLAACRFATPDREIARVFRALAR